jgi:omega-6 fatty acid desaturase (delta-12 desaturase)
MPAPDRMAASFRRDRLAVAAYLIVMSAAVAWAGWQQTGSTLGTTWIWAKVLLVPWLMWNVLIGWAVYIQHISPSMAWHSRRRWRKFAGQVETTSNFRMPRWLNFFGHNILVHVPHHVDPRIPFYNLPAANDALTRGHPDVADSQPYHLSDYLQTTRSCKLYDFEREAWTGYDGVLSVSPRSA